MAPARLPVEEAARIGAGIFGHRAHNPLAAWILSGGSVAASQDSGVRPTTGSGSGAAGGATGRRSPCRRRGRTRSARIWKVRWPLPAIRTASPGSASASAASMARRRSGSTRTRPGRRKPASRSSRIWSGSSVRGLSVVRMTRSAPASAASASAEPHRAVAGAPRRRGRSGPCPARGRGRRPALAAARPAARLVDPDVEVLSLVDRLEPAGDAGDRLQPGDDRVERQAARPGDGRRGQGLRDVARADQPELDGRLAVEAAEQEPRARGGRAARSWRSRRRAARARTRPAARRG